MSLILPRRGLISAAAAGGGGGGFGYTLNGVDADVDGFVFDALADYYFTKNTANTISSFFTTKTCNGVCFGYDGVATGDLNLIAANTPYNARSPLDNNEKWGVELYRDFTERAYWDVSNNTYYASNNVTLTTDGTLSPTGDEMRKITTSSTFGNRNIDISYGTDTWGVTYFYASKGSSDRFDIKAYSIPDTIFLARWDWVSGVPVPGAASGGTDRHYAINCGNGVYLCVIEWSTTTAHTTNLQIRPATINAVDSTYIWGFLTQHHTTDTLTLSPLNKQTPGTAISGTNFRKSFGTWFNNTNGTFFFEFKCKFVQGNITPAIFGIRVDANNFIRATVLPGSNANSVLLEIYSGGVLQASLSAGLTGRDQDTWVKMAFRYANNDVALAVNGELATDTTCTIPTLTGADLKFGGFDTNDDEFTFNGNMRAAAYWPTLGSNAELTDLSNNGL